MSIRRAQDERLEGTPDGLAAISEVMDFPDAPSAVSAVDVGTSRAYNNGAATVTVTAATTGGTPTTYNIISTPGSFTASGASPVTVTGLQSNTAYTFQATGVNANSIAGIQSSASGSITATTVPQAPTIGTATDQGSGRAYNNGQASVTFTAGATGGKTISSYTVTSSPGSFTASGAASPLTVTGLQSATAYTYTVTATNANGTSTASSASGSVTATTVPQAPTIGTASVSGLTASVPFTAGATGGATVTTYTATSSPGNITGTSASSPISVSGLTAGTAYTFTVTATNANGTSAASSASNSVTPISYFIQKAGAIVYGLSGDSSGNIYAMNADNVLGAGKEDTSGTHQWTYSTSTTMSPRNSAISANTNGVIVGGYSSANNYTLALVKFNSSGGVTWQKNLTNSYTGAGNYRYVGGVCVDSSDNTYVSGTRAISNAGPKYAFLAKYNSSGTQQWANGYSGGTDNYASHIAVDSSGNVYTVITKDTSSKVIKLNSSGTIQWGANPASNTTGFNTFYTTNTHALCVDSSGNVFVSATDGSNIYLNTWKFNSSGVIQWGRQLYIGATGDVWSEPTMAMDSSGNVYVGVQSNRSVVAKYDTNGNLSWQRALSSGQNFYNYGMYADSNSLYIGTWYIGTTGFIFKVPLDGSKTGTYTVGGTSITYAASSFATASAASPTDAGGTNPTVTTFGYTESTPTNTYSSSANFLNGSGTTTLTI